MLNSSRAALYAFLAWRFTLTWSVVTISNQLLRLLQGRLVHCVGTEHLSHKSPSCKFKNLICIEYCGHIWSGASAVHLEIPDKIQKRVCNIIDLDRAFRQSIVSLFTWADYIISFNLSSVPSSVFIMATQIFTPGLLVSLVSSIRSNWQLIFKIIINLLLNGIRSVFFF